ncbi:MAG: hypothetical protein IPN69_08215 [Acidobacteria bacterium]|nr:hypothetical protein [Acidobacteriota bacterium]
MLNFSDFLIYVIPADREYDSDGNYVPNFLIRADDYDGTIFDHDPRAGIGYIYAAEFVIPESLGAARGEFVIADYSRNFETAEEAIRNGPEHLILYINDRPKYEKTKFHGRGISHPLI